MEEEMAISQRLIKEGADPVMLEQYRYYQETGNLQGQYRLVCRFRRIKSEELEKEREKLACLDYMIAKVEKTLLADQATGVDETAECFNSQFASAE